MSLRLALAPLAASIAVLVAASGGTVHAEQPAAEPRGGGNFIIDLIHYRQGGGGLNNEYLKVKNTSQRKRKLTNFRIVDASDGQRYRFPRTTLKPGRSVTLFTGRSNDSPGKRYWGRGTPAWNDDGDTARLVNTQGNVIDRCSYNGGDANAGGGDQTNC